MASLCVQISLCCFLAVINLASAQTGAETTLPYEINEGLTAGSEIGNILQDAELSDKYNNDQSILSQLEFKLRAVNTEFAIGLKTGILTAITDVERDLVCANQASCSVPLDIVVEPVDYYESIKVTVIINDINDNIPTFLTPEFAATISEASNQGASVSIPTASDPDSPVNGIVRYELSASDTFDLKVVNNTAVDLYLVLKGDIDREVKDSYELNLTAFDGGDQSATMKINVQLTDVNDNNPVFLNQIYETTVKEDIEVDTSLISVQASDADTGLNGEVVYRFSDKTEAEFGDIFRIDGDTGEIFSSGALDYDTHESYVLSVEAGDKGANSIPTVTRVTVKVEDTNDNSPQVVISSGQLEVSENVPPPKTVAILKVTDPDSGPSGTFNCSLVSAEFKLEQKYTDEYSIVTRTEFDREEKEDYEVNVICQDNGEQSLVTVEKITVRIKDENDHYPKFSQLVYSVTVLENNKVGASIELVEASDEDAGANAALKYSISGEDADKFYIDPFYGNISAAEVLDHETMTKTKLIVTVSDQGNPPKSANATVNVNIIDVDDEVPTFTEASYSFSIEENLPVNSEVNQVSATDKDTDDSYNKFTFSFDEESNLQNAFVIDSQTGKIYTRQVLDREQKGIYELVVVARSTGVTRLSSTVSVSVYVADKNDNVPIIDFPNLFNNTLHISSDEEQGTIIGRVLAHDDDVGQNAQLTYSLVSQTEEFDVDQTTGVLRINKKLHSTTDKVFELEVIVKDNGNPYAVAVETLNIVVNKSLAIPAKGLVNKQNLTIVISIGCITGVLVVILAVCIAIVILRQSKEKEKRMKYNYVARTAEQGKWNLVQKADKNGVDNLGATDLSLNKKPNPHQPKDVPDVAYVNPSGDNMETSMSYPSYDFEPNQGRTPSRFSSSSSGVWSNYRNPNKDPQNTVYMYESQHTVHKPNPISPDKFRQPIPIANPILERAAADSDSACSADMSNTDSGHGSNEDGSDGHAGPASPQTAPQQNRRANDGQASNLHPAPNQAINQWPNPGPAPNHHPNYPMNVRTQNLYPGVHRTPSHDESVLNSRSSTPNRPYNPNQENPYQRPPMRPKSNSFQAHEMGLGEGAYGNSSRNYAAPNTRPVPPHQNYTRSATPQNHQQSSFHSNSSQPMQWNLHPALEEMTSSNV